LPNNFKTIKLNINSGTTAGKKIKENMISDENGQNIQMKKESPMVKTLVMNRTAIPFQKDFRFLNKK